MRKEVLLAGVLAISGCSVPKPSLTPEPASTRDPRVVEMVDCIEGPFAAQTVVHVNADYLSLAARRASDHEEIRIKIIPSENRRFGISPENTSITDLKQPQVGLLEFNASGISFVVDGRHNPTGEFFVAASAECTDIRPVEPVTQS